MQRIRRPLDPIELRVLGSLLEKQRTTPEYYPLSLNALGSAVNQKSNREPVMEVSEEEIAAALDRLQEMNLVWRVLGGRTTKWEQNVEKKWELDPPMRAVLTLLFLRGAQTVGEIRGRADRLHDFASLDEVETILARMKNDADPFVTELPRRPGQKESRWMHLFGAVSALEMLSREETPAAPGATSSAPRGSLESRVQALESRIEELSQTIRLLLEKLGE